MRDLFEQAKQNAPCIVFIDEIDAVGRQRGAGLGGGHDEREQTLNQLLVEMDGFEHERRRHRDGRHQPAGHPRPGAAAARPLRPADRRRPPGRQGREAILKVHSRGKPLAEDVDLDALAAQTPGFSGADLANLVNEAALLAARHARSPSRCPSSKRPYARRRRPEKKSRIISEKEKAILAYHEMGHALVGHCLDTDPVHKISCSAAWRSATPSRCRAKTSS